MAVITIPRAIRKQHHRRAQYNAAVTKLAPAFAELHAQGIYGNVRLTDALNALELVAPSGNLFKPSTTGDILKRLKKLGLGDGPRSLSEAARARLPNDSSKPRSTGRGSTPAEELARLGRYEKSDEVELSEPSEERGPDKTKAAPRIEA